MTRTATTATTTTMKDTATALTAGALVASGFIVATLLKKRRESNKYTIPSKLRSSPYLAELKLALRMALEAGANMRVHLDSKGTQNEKTEADLGISMKGQEEDFCTAIDVLNEKLVIQGIQTNFPSHAIIGEESTGTGEIPQLTKVPTWIIDPIDGTTNFAAGLPLECVSIGYCVDGIPVMGVVYSPMTDEVYIGVKGFGSFRNGIQLLKSTANNVTLSRAVVNYEFGYAREETAIKRMVTAVENIMKHGCRTTRTLGSGVLDLCYVASKRLDVVYAGVANEGWKPWDYCAGSVIATEAGCSIESLHGDDFDLYSKSIICATSKELLDETRSVLMKGL